MRDPTARLVSWLLLLAAGQLVAFEAVRRIFVTTVRGQQLDTAALAGNSIGESHIAGPVSTVLSTVSVLSVLAAIAVIGFIALVRGRVAQAVAATAMILGANITTQLVKSYAIRPDLGVDPERVIAGNSLPSGHATVTASVAVALVLVLPAAVRGIAALAGAGVTTLVGVATVSADWHRPSDVVAALLVVGAWAAVAGAALALWRRYGRDGARPGDLPHRAATVTLAAAGFGLLVAAAVALVVTDQVRDVPAEALGRTRLLVAYAGSAVGVAGMACAVIAPVLATVHRLVPPSRLLVHAPRRNGA